MPDSPIDRWQTTQAAHSGLETSAWLTHTPAGHAHAQGKPALHWPSPTPDMHAFSPVSYLQQPTAAHSVGLSPLFSQASSPFWPAAASDRAREGAAAESPRTQSQGCEAKEGLMLARICFAASHCCLACSAEMVPDPSKAPSAIMDEL